MDIKDILSVLLVIAGVVVIISIIISYTMYEVTLRRFLKGKHKKDDSK